MKRSTCLTILFLLFFTSIAQAQEDTAPWPPDLSEIFAQGVEILAVEIRSTEFVPTPTSVDAWTYYINSETGQTFLSRHGELSDPLPREVSPWYDIYPSPSSNWLVLDGVDAETAGRGGPNRYYGYEVGTGQINYIGSLSSRDEMYFARWISDTEGLIYSGGMPESAGKAFYYFDVTEPDSFEVVITGRAEYHSNPPRYEYLNTHYKTLRYSDPRDHLPCRLDVYDITTRASFTYELGYDCGGVYETPDGRYYYVAIGEDTTQPATLYSLDIFTGDRIEIMSGEFEALESVSPSGRYAALITDDSGVIERAGSDPQFFSWDTPHNPRLTIFDLSSGDIIFQTNFEGRVGLTYLYEDVDHGGMYWGRPDTNVVWSNEERPIVISSNRLDATLLNLGDQVSETHLGRLAYIPEGRNQLLIWKDESNGLESLNGYDLTTDTWIPITQPLNNEQLRIYIGDQIDSATFMLTLMTADENDDNRPVNYTIRLP